MSASHHGDSGTIRRDEELMQRLMDQMANTAKRQYPAGRMGHEDDGALSYAIATDAKAKTVVIRFGKPIEWMGLGAAECVQLAQQLIARAREISEEPITVSL